MSLVTLVIITDIVVSCTTFILFFLILYWIKKKTKTKPSSTTSSVGKWCMSVSYNDLLKATNGFYSTNLLGVGSFGSVYKGILDEEKEEYVAIKVLNLQQRGATKSFMAECNTLRKVRHRNLLKIMTCCSSIDNEGNDFKALVYEFMAYGSLENWLHPSNPNDDLLRQPRNLSLEKRLDIAIDVAAALGYLHHHCKPSILHRDLKPSNVLLDEHLIAHVGDFGLAKFLYTSNFSGKYDRTNSVAIEGSLGYIAPEYGMGGRVSTQGDVYSYGILLLEIFTGKKPTDDIFKDGLSLHSFSKRALPLQVMDILDSSLLLEVEGDNDEVINQNMKNDNRCITRNKIQVILASIIRLGVVCSSPLPSDRVSMKEVIVDLQVAKDLLLGVRWDVTKNKTLDWSWLSNPELFIPIRPLE